MTVHDDAITTHRIPKDLVRGGVGGMLAGIAMAMFAMIASATYQHHGFFTPLFHISALFGSPASMITSIQHAMSGQSFWFTPGAAVAGLAIHMGTSAAYGMMFALVARMIPRKALLVVGVVYGLLVFAFSSFVALPLAASVTGAGDSIKHMARLVGWSTFALEHVMFGLVLGTYFYVTSRSESQERTPPVVAPQALVI